MSLEDRAKSDGHDRMDTLLLVTHVVVRNGPNGYQIDDQTAAGIAQWCKHFDRVTYYGIADSDRANAGSTAWVDINAYPGAERCELKVLPRAYRVDAMIREYRQVRATLRSAISTHRHLCFTIGGLLGDWPAVAALESIKQKRSYSAWIDRVEPFIILNKTSGASLSRKLVVKCAIPIMEQYTKHLLRSSSVALLQGRDTFDHYAEWCPNPQCTYDTHTHAADQISDEFLRAKCDRILGGAPLRILYVGRADAMKGPHDWLDVLELLSRETVTFQATWVGDGPELGKMQERVSHAPLCDNVHLSGFEGDRIRLLRAMQESDILLFCHKTRESPRCLIEALVCGCALVGYDTAYPRGLVQAHGGALFAPQNEVETLAQRVLELNQDRLSLVRLVLDAAESGKDYTEDAVYAFRASLMHLDKDTPL